MFMMEAKEDSSSGTSSSPSSSSSSSPQDTRSTTKSGDPKRQRNARVQVGGGGGGGDKKKKPPKQPSRPVATTSIPSLNSAQQEFKYEPTGPQKDTEAAPRAQRVDPYGKSVCSAVVMIPPPEVWPPIQAIRRLYDNGYVRWPPHVNMLYPFLHNFQFPHAFEKLAAALASFPSFQITLKEFRYFKHASSTTVWLHPETSPDPDALTKLQAIMQQTFPTCDDLSRISGHGFVPHLSVANDTKNPKQAEELIAEFTKEWKSLTFTVKEIYMISRMGGKDIPFDIRYAIPLASSPCSDSFSSETTSTSTSTSTSASIEAGSISSSGHHRTSLFECNPIVQTLEELDKEVLSQKRIRVQNVGLQMTEDEVTENLVELGKQAGVAVGNVMIIRKTKRSGRAKNSSTGQAFCEVSNAHDQLKFIDWANNARVEWVAGKPLHFSASHA